jgi:hypothetical protein
VDRLTDLNALLPHPGSPQGIPEAGDASEQIHRSGDVDVDHSPVRRPGCGVSVRHGRSRGVRPDVVLRGLSMVCDDEQILVVTGAILDGLYEFLRRQLLTEREPS